ncbi:MAG: lipase/acyltransferase domain-containing protein [Hyphomicrobiaceae bacterium]
MFGKLSVVMFVSVLFCCATATAQVKRPIIFVPGIVGSQLSDSSGDVVWGDSGSLNSSNFKKLDLLPANANPVSLNATDVLRGVPLVFGLIEVGVYSGLIDFLTGKRSITDRFTGRNITGSYHENRTLFVFPYDWRRTNFASAKRLNTFIEKHVPSGQYDLIAHSMGGIITRIMLDGRSPKGVCQGGTETLSGLSSPTGDELTTLCNAMYGTPTGTSWPNENFNGPHSAASRLHTYIEMAVPHYGSNNVIGTYSEGWGALSQILIGGQREIQDIILSMSSPIELAATHVRCCAVGHFGASHNQEINNIDQILEYKFWSQKVLGFGNSPCPYTTLLVHTRGVT